MKPLLPFVLAASLATAACGTTPAQMELAGCDVYASTLTQLATLKSAGKLSATQIKYVDDARVGLNAICMAPPPDVDAKALNIALDAGVKSLQSIVLIVGGK